MIAQAKTMLRRLLVTIGLALVALVLLLSWSAVEGSGVQAPSHKPEVEPSQMWQDFGVAWASMDITYTKDVTSAGYVWEIDDNDITLTFQLNSVSNPEPTTVFTFTPQSGDTLPSPLIGSYFYHLDGMLYWGAPVSIDQPYTITLHYQESDLNGARENSLQLYYQVIETAPDVITTWVPVDNITVDPAQNIIQGSTRTLGRFAVGGYAFQTYIPLVTRNYSN